MRIYFRLLSFAKPIEKFAIPFVLFTFFAVVFSTFNLALIAPLLTTLFVDQTVSENASLLVMPAFTWEFSYIKELFNYYFNKIATGSGKTGGLYFVGAMLVITNLFGNLFKYLAARMMEAFKIHVLLKLRKESFDKVMDLHLGYFNNQRKGDIISKITSDIQTMQYTVTGTLQVLFKEPLQLISYLVVLLMISVKLTLFALLVIPVSVFLITQIVKNLRKQATQSAEIYGMMLSYLDEALSGIKIMHAFDAFAFVKNRFNAQNRAYSKIARSMSKKQQLASPISEFLGVCTVVGILLYGGNLIFNQNSELSPEAFIAYIVIFSQVMTPVKALTNAFNGIHAGLAAGKRVFDLMDTQPEVCDQPDAKPAMPFSKALVFDRVSFGYTDKPVLNNLSFTLRKGQTLALVGPSGGGKSTISDLIPRFYDVNSGAILFDGVDIRQLSRNSLRAQIGLVSQESILFNDTIFNNIAFGLENTPLEKVVAAAKVAHAHDFILAAGGYQTSIGDSGIKLSGGQKQRLNIARAVLHNPAILILDEATSALDTQSEQMVQLALNNLMQSRTSLVIAHRLSTIQAADLILVLDKGSLIQQGTHEQLIAEKGGLYKKLIDMQSFDAS